MIVFNFCVFVGNIGRFCGLRNVEMDCTLDNDTLSTVDSNKICRLKTTYLSMYRGFIFVQGLWVTLSDTLWDCIGQDC